MNTIPTLRILAVAGVVSATLAATGCVAGNTTRVEGPTLGRQLIELKDAYDQGAMSKAEYEEQRARMLRQGGSHTHD